MREVHPADECPTIRHRFFLTGGDQDGIGRFLVVAFAGTYGGGSQGNPDARYMYGLVSLACGLWPHAGLVIDLSGLSYEWGDQIEMVLSHPYGGHSALVVGPNCAGALGTLIADEYPAQPVTDLEWVFDNLPDALAYLAAHKP